MEEELLNRFFNFDEISQSLFDTLHKGEAIAQELKEALDDKDNELGDIDQQTKNKILDQFRSFLKDTCKILGQVNSVLEPGGSPSLVDDFQKRLSQFTLTWTGEEQPDWVRSLEAKLVHGVGLRLTQEEISQYIKNIQSTLGDAANFDENERKKLADNVRDFTSVFPLKQEMLNKNRE